MTRDEWNWRVDEWAFWFCELDVRDSLLVSSFHISKWAGKKIIPDIFISIYSTYWLLSLLGRFYPIVSLVFYTRSKIIRASVGIIILDGITKGPPTFQRVFSRRGSSLTRSHVPPRHHRRGAKYFIPSYEHKPSYFITCAIEVAG